MKAILALALLSAALGAPAGEPGRPSGLSLALELGPLAGLDRAFRGLEAELLLGLEAGGLGALLSLGLDWDRGLGGALAQAELGLSLGPGLALSAGAELPLGRAEAEAGGALLVLEPAPWPCRFGLSALLAELPSPPRGPRASLAAELSYSAYRVARAGAPGGGPAPPLAEAAAGLSGFALGFRAELALRLTWAARAAGPPGRRAGRAP